MSGYFKPLRRKLGVVTLVMACVFMAGWVRSFNGGDHRQFYRGGDYERFAFVSIDGNVEWRKFSARNPHTLTPAQFMQLGLDVLNILEGESQRTIKWNWNLCGCGSGEYSSEYLDYRKSDEPIGSIEYTFWRFPYWSLVISLTLLSAWLLFSKPRQAHPVRATRIEPQ